MSTSLFPSPPSCNPYGYPDFQVMNSFQQQLYGAQQIIDHLHQELSLSQNNLSQSQEELKKSQDDLRRSQYLLQLTRAELSRSQHELHQSKQILSQSQTVLSQSQHYISELEQHRTKQNHYLENLQYGLFFQCAVCQVGVDDFDEGAVHLCNCPEAQSFCRECFGQSPYVIFNQPLAQCQKCGINLCSDCQYNHPNVCWNCLIPDKSSPECLLKEKKEKDPMRYLRESEMTQVNEKMFNLELTPMPYQDLDSPPDMALMLTTDQWTDLDLSTTLELDQSYY